MAGLCKDCRWWDHGPGWTPEPHWWGYCELTDVETKDYRSDVPDTKAYVPYLDHWARPDRLATAPDFGCVQWEATHNIEEEDDASR